MRRVRRGADRLRNGNTGAKFSSAVLQADRVLCRSEQNSGRDDTDGELLVVRKVAGRPNGGQESREKLSRQTFRVRTEAPMTPFRWQFLCHRFPLRLSIALRSAFDRDEPSVPVVGVGVFLLDTG
jgi:hypothetical protein